MDQLFRLILVLLKESSPLRQAESMPCIELMSTVAPVPFPIFSIEHYQGKAIHFSNLRPREWPFQDKQMNYFTPQLFESLNSRTIKTQLRALEKWDEAEKNYLSARDKWLHSAPSGLQHLVKRFCGHDAKILARGQSGDTLIVILIDSEEIVWKLGYQLNEDAKMIKSQRNAECWSDASHRIWLYDEVAQIANAQYQHEILFSDGSIMQIHFSDVQIKKVSIDKNFPKWQKYDLKLEFSISATNLKTAFRQVSLFPQAPSKRKSSKRAIRSKTDSRQKSKKVLHSSRRRLTIQKTG